VHYVKTRNDIQQQKVILKNAAKQNHGISTPVNVWLVTNQLQVWTRLYEHDIQQEQTL